MSRALRLMQKTRAALPFKEGAPLWFVFIPPACQSPCAASTPAITETPFTMFSCNECAKALIQSGISQVIYYEDKYADSDSVIASKRMFDMVGIRYTPYKRTGRGVELAL